ncbi:MAG: Ig-like domain-containing protein, partial [Bacteroidota bacterium]
PFGGGFFFFQTFVNTPLDLYMDETLFDFDDQFVFQDPSNGAVIIDTPINLGYDPNDPNIAFIDTLIRYQPNLDFTGVDTFQLGFAFNNFQDTALFGIEILVSGTPPDPDVLIVNDDAYDVTAGITTSLDVLTNDQGNQIYLSTATGSANSTVTISNGQIQYTPNPGFEGTDFITYVACDGSASCATGNVTVTVYPGLPDTFINLVTEETDPVVIDGFDLIGFPFFLPPTILTPPSNGTFTTDATSIIYTADPGFIGQDNFTFEICFDAFTCLVVQVTVNVVPAVIEELAVNDDIFDVPAGVSSLLDVLANDTGEGLEIASIFGSAFSNVSIFGTQISYTPIENFEGVDQIQYIACDDFGGCETGTVTINVAPAAPDFFIDLVTELETPVTLSGFDALGFPFFSQPTVVDFASNGSVITTAQEIIYTPNPGFIGVDSFEVQICIDQFTCFNILVVVDVLPGGSTFDLVDDFFQVAPGETTVMNVLINDGGSNLSITDVTDAANGQVYIINNFLSYTPDAGFEGNDQVTYTACDNFGNCGTAVVNIDVSDPNTLIIDATTPQDVTLYIPLEIFPFIDFNWTIGSTPLNGSIELYPTDTTLVTDNGPTNFPSGVVVYTPNPGYVGPDEFDLIFEWIAGGINLTVNFNIDVLPTQDCNSACVWPGDTNNNGEVDQFDVLALGLTMGETGPARTDASLNWIGQQGDDWGTNVPDLNVNSKFTDTDGNGIAEMADTLAINQNYGLTHGTPGLLPTQPASQQIWLQPSSDVIFPGMTLTVEIFVATDVLPMTNLYGFGTEFRYDPLFVDPVTVNAAMETNNFMSNNSPMLGIAKNHFDGRLDLAYSRTTGVPVNGYGKVGEVTFIVIDNIDGLVDGGDIDMDISLKGTTMMDHNGEMYELGDFTISLPVGQTTSVEEVATVDDLQWSVFPNPTFDQVTVEWSNTIQDVSAITLFDVTGRVALHRDIDQGDQLNLNLGELTAGSYILQLTHREGQLRRKVMVLR